MQRGVNLQEARARLGLPAEGSLDKRALRAAYLQAVKRHKPEADPEGFQQVRSAYELLDRMVALGLDRTEAAADPPSPPEVAPLAPLVVPPTTPDPPQPDAPEAPASDHLEPYRARLRDQPYGPWPVRAEIAWQAYDAFPGDPAA